jgi:hypothetical protein
MSKINPKLLDQVFDGVELPDNTAMIRQTAIAKRNQSGWYEKNNQRLQDPEYVKKLSESIKDFYQANPNFQKDKVKSQQWQQAHKKGCQEHVNSPDYVNPRGMLGKKQSKESKKKLSEKLKGQIKPIDGNKKISEARLGRKPKQESIEKMRKSLTGRESGRSRQIQTPSGVFNKLKDAADFYGVATGSIKNFIKGQNVKEWFKPHLEAKGVKFKGLKPLGFKWLGDVKQELGAKSVQTPDGIFTNVNEAAEFYKITSTAVRYRINSQPDRYFYIK